MYRTDNAEALREQRSTYRSTHAEVLRARNHAYYIANIEAERMRAQAYYIANAEAVRERVRVRYANNIEAEHRRNQVYRSTHPDGYRARNQNRQKRVKANGGYFTRQELTTMRIAQAGICAYCCYQYDPDVLTIDHIIPIAQGGRHEAPNICLACPRCNFSKGNRTPEQWINRWYEQAH